MPYSAQSRKTPEARAKLRAAYRRWYENAKTTNSPAWQHRQQAARQRAPRYKQKRAEYQKRMWAEDPQRGLAYGRKHKLKVAEAKAGRKKPIHCEVCGGTGKHIAFDHCHQTGVFRGWLCFHCNAILGHARDNPDLLQKLATYLMARSAVPASHSH